MSELHGLQSRMEEFKSEGYEIVAVSPDSSADNQRVAMRLGLDFPILSDGELELTKALGLLHEKAGPGGADIPRPAVFVIQNGQIKHRDLTDNWRVRVKADDLLAVLRSL